MEDHIEHSHIEHSHIEHSHIEHSHIEHSHIEHRHGEHRHGEHRHGEHRHGEHRHGEHRHGEHDHDRPGHGARSGSGAPGANGGARGRRIGRGPRPFHLLRVVDHDPFPADVEMRVSSVHAEPLVRDVADLLARQLDHGGCFLILEVEGPDPEEIRGYVQTLALPDGGLLAECAGERYVTYTDEQLAEIARLGWPAPGVPPVTPSDSAGNFSVVWDEPHIPQAAQLLTLTLIRVHGLERPEQLHIVVGNSPAAARGGRS